MHAEPFRNLAETLRVACDHRHLGLLGHQRLDDAAPEPAAASRDDDLLPFEIFHAIGSFPQYLRLDLKTSGHGKRMRGNKKISAASFAGPASSFPARAPPGATSGQAENEDAGKPRSA